MTPPGRREGRSGGAQGRAPGAARRGASAPVRVPVGLVGHLTLDAGARILSADRHTALLLARAPEKLAGVSFDTLVAEPDRERLRKHLSRPARSLAQATIRVRLRGGDEKPVPVLLVSSPGRLRKGAEGEVDVVLVTGTGKQHVEKAPRPSRGNRHPGDPGPGAGAGAGEDRLRSLPAVLPQMVWTADAAGAVDHQTLQALEPGAEGRTEAEGWGWALSVHPDDLETTLAAWRRALATGEPYLIEHRILKSDGDFRWHLTRGAPIRDGRGRVVRWIGSTTDVQDVREALDRVRESESLLRAVIDGAFDPIFVKDRESRLILANPAFLEILGKGAGEVLGRTVEEVHASPESARAIRENDRRVMESGQTLTLEETVETPRGRRVFYAVKSPRRDARGTVIGLIGVVHDITDRRREAEALEAARAEAENERNRLRAVLETLPVGVAILDAQGGSVASNPAFEEIWGPGRPLIEQVEDYGVYKAWWKDSDLAVRPDEWASARAVRDGETVVGQLLRIERFDGRGAFVSNSAAPIRDSLGRITGSAVAMMDISGTVEVENALREAKRDWERTFDSVPDLIAILDEEFRIVRVNRAMADRLRRTPAQCHGLPCFSVVHGSSCPVPACPHALTLQTGREHVQEIREQALGGDFLVSTTPLFDEQGRMTGSVHVARDITERKKMEAAQARLNRTLAAISESSQAMLRATTEAEYLHDVCRIVVEVCGHAMAWIGFAEDEERGSVRAAAHAGRDDGYLATLDLTWKDEARGRGPAGTAIRTGQPASCRDMRADPSFVPWREAALARGYASSVAVPLLDGERAIGALTIYSPEAGTFSAEDVSLLTKLASDLTFGIGVLRLREANVAAVASLRQSEERYRALVESSPEAVLVDRDGRIDYANPAALALFGATEPSRILGRTPYELFPPGDHDVLGKRIARLKAGHAVPLREERIVRVDGAIRDAEVIATPFDDSAGRGIQVILRDVTDRKRAERDLRIAFEQARRREQEMAALLGAARAALESRSFDEAARAIFSECRTIVGASGGAIVLRENDGPGLRLACSEPGNQDWWALDDGGSSIAGLRERASRTRQCVTGANLDPAGRSTGHLLVTPLVVAGEIAGFLGLSGAARPFSAEDARLATAFAEMASVALLFSRSLEILERQVKERTRELEEANRSLASERQRLFSLLEELPLYVFLRAADQSIVFANRYLREQFGEPAGRRCYDVLGGEGTPCATCKASVVLETGLPASWDWTSPGRRSFQIHNYPFTDADGSRLILELGIDVTPLRRAYEAEQSARKTADTLREASLAVSRSLDLGNVLTSLLENVRKRVPYDRAKALVLERSGRLSARVLVEGEKVSTLSHDAAPPFSLEESPVVREVLDGRGTVVLTDVRSHPVWGKQFPEGCERSWMGVPLIARGGPVGMFSIGRREPGGFDGEEESLVEALSAQASVAIENALLFEEVEAARETMQTLSRRVVAVQEEERRSIARELHDEAGQSLTSLLLGLRLLERDGAAPATPWKGIPDLKRTAEEVLESLHRLAANLRPASLDHLGLEAALRQHLAGVELKTGLTIRFRARGLDRERLPLAVETALYRVVQEATTNVLRHARASSVDVLAELRQDRVVVMVEDDGVGFVAEAANGVGRLGLVGMRERAETLGGTFSVESVPGSGTTVYVEVPCADPHPDRR